MIAKLILLSRINFKNIYLFQYHTASCAFSAQKYKICGADESFSLTSIPKKSLNQSQKCLITMLWNFAIPFPCKKLGSVEHSRGPVTR